MTTVACSLITRTMAADSRCNQGDTLYEVRKIIRLKEGLLATAGSRYLTGAFEEGFKNGARIMEKPEVPDDEQNFEAVWMTDEGIWLYDVSFYPEKVGVICAIGSGSQIAMSYLLDGLAPEEAVKRACRVDINSGLPVYVESLEKRLAHTKAQ